jgi:hypothetical protein
MLHAFGFRDYLYKKYGTGIRAYLGGCMHQRGRVSLLKDLGL